MIEFADSCVTLLSMQMPSVVVRHNVSETRFEATIEGSLAVVEYAREKNSLVVTHTFVPVLLRGRGIAEQLVRAALDYARGQKLSVIPVCSYVAQFVARHPEYADLVG